MTSPKAGATLTPAPHPNDDATEHEDACCALPAEPGREAPAPSSQTDDQCCAAPEHDITKRETVRK